MHVHQSIFKTGKNVFYDASGDAELSQTALAYTAGLLSHTNGILAITNPTLNSYRRLVPHFEAPFSPILPYFLKNCSQAISK